MNNKRLLRDAVIIGLALFSTFFGAGNLIFPPTVGFFSGTAWFAGAIGLLLTAIILPVSSVWSVSNTGPDVNCMMIHVHPKAYTAVCIVGWLVSGIGSTLPRCSAMTHEVGIRNIFPGVPIWVTVPVFFVAVYYFARDTKSLIEKLGKYLTPVLLVVLAIVLIKGVVSPIGEPAAPQVENALSFSMLQGYLVGDLTLGIFVANTFISELKAKGYDRKGVRKGIILAGIVCAIAMFAVYGTLTYIGACGSSLFPAGTEQTALLSGCVDAVLGRAGLTCLGIAIALACLTTAVAVASTLSTFYSEFFHNKVTYKQVLLFACVVCSILGITGVTNIINYVTPVFLTMYPPFIVMTVLGLVDGHIPNDGLYKGGVYTAAFFGFLDGVMAVFPGFTALSGILSYIPLYSAGFGWLIPTVIAMVIGAVLYRNKPRQYYDPETRQVV